jgi:hypothetical protein
MAIRRTRALHAFGTVGRCAGQPRRARRWLRRTGLAFCFGLAATQPVLAANDVVIFTDRDLGDAAGPVVAPLRSPARVVETDVRAMDAACTTLPGNRVRLAVLARMPNQAEMDVCAGGISADVTAVPLGHQAIALATPSAGPVFSVSANDLFRAFGANAGGPLPASWDGLNLTYPAAPVSILAPRPGSVARQLFDAQMEAGCVASVAATKLPFDRAGRTVFCGALRVDPAVRQRDAAPGAVAEWAKAAGPGAVAVMSVTELPPLDGAATALLIDNVAPSAANISSGRYPAARPVSLMVVLPRATDAPRREAARQAAFDLMSEGMIGPSGALNGAGLVALPPADRVAARAKAVAFIE